MVNWVYVCNRCGLNQVSDNALYSMIKCECNGAMYLQTKPDVDKPLPVIGNVSVPSESSLMGFALELDAECFKPVGGLINLGRKENINGLYFDLMRAAVDQNVSKVGKRTALKLALRIDNVSLTTARGYVEHLVDAGLFDCDGECLLIDLERAKELLK